MLHRLRTAAAALLLIAAACDSPTTTDKTPPLAAGAAVQGTVTPGKSNTYQLEASEAEFRVMLRAGSGRDTDTLVAAVLDANGQTVGTVRSVGTDSTLAEQGTDWLPAPGRAKWRVVVRGASADDGGAYTVQVFPRDPAPETAPAALTLGQVVEGEALDVDGDVDEFTVTAAAGAEWIIFAQRSLASHWPMQVQLVEKSTGTVVTGMETYGPDEVVEGRSTGRIAVPGPGQFIVRVRGQGVRGPYRLRVDAVNRAPETGAAAVALGAVVGESIGSVGDVDEFTFTTTTPGQEVSLLLQLQQGMSAGMKVELLHAGQLVGQLQANTPAASLNEVGTGRVALPAAGVYTVRVSGPVAGHPAAATGSYRLELYPVDRRPELGGEVRLDGPAVAGAIDRPGDVDEYTLQGTAGQLVVVYASGEPRVHPQMHAAMLAPDGSVVGSTGVSQVPEPSYGRRFRLPVTGTYRLRVGGEYDWMMGFGPYTVGAYTVDPAPEHVPAAIAIGQTVTGERIDKHGDLDVFTFTGQAGRTVNLFTGATPDVRGIFTSIREASATSAYMYTTLGTLSLDGTGTGRIPLESTGYVVTVDPQSLGRTEEASSGAYAFRVFEIDRRPEGRAATYVLGDTVKGEALYPSGDIDEYRFDLAATTTIRAYWSGPVPPSQVDIWTLVLGNLYNEDTGQTVWGNTSEDERGPIRQFTLPAGRYRFRVWNPNLEAPSDVAQAGRPRLDYQFAFIRQ